MAHDPSYSSKETNPSAVNLAASTAAGGDDGGSTRCPRCGAQFVGVEPCPDPTIHRRPHHVPIPLYGGQQPPYRTWYDTDEKGRALLTFRRRDGAERAYPVIWAWRDPATGRRYPYMIDLPVLRRDDLLFILGLSDSSLNAIAAQLPGRTASYLVECETTTLVKEWHFGFLAEKPTWTRMPRSQKHQRLHATCIAGCRRRHRN
jgi:hypothetical protein